MLWIAIICAVALTFINATALVAIVWIVQSVARAEVLESERRLAETGDEIVDTLRQQI
jgi:hypothetical protein